MQHKMTRSDELTEKQIEDAKLAHARLSQALEREVEAMRGVDDNQFGIEPLAMACAHMAGKLINALPLDARANATNLVMRTFAAAAGAKMAMGRFAPDGSIEFDDQKLDS